MRDREDIMQQLCVDGRFFIGCNYWASHAGTHMWRDWDPAVVEDDMRRLSRDKIRVLRMFPLWPDFQPIKQMYKAAGVEKEIRMDAPGEPLFPDTEEGRAGINPVMADRFRVFCDLAEKYRLRLVVGLLTGWMSGRLYVPAALERRNVLTDPFCIRWELKFVKYMVSRFKDHPAIAAWDLGNECNCMGTVTDSDEAALWAETITDAIKVCDSEHPVVSGMHGLRPEGTWRAGDQGSFLDVLTTHPYPIFVPHCNTDPLDEFKPPLHAAAESLFYSGLGGKPCFAEEAGTLGPMIASEKIAAEYVSTCMATLWAHNCYGFLWWCANEQSHLTHAPYDWNAVERELGLYRLDGSPKPVAEAMSAFSDYIWQMGTLPKRLTDGVCLVTPGQDQWAAAYGTFMLAKQAGLDVDFAWINDPIPDAPVYFLPSLAGDSGVSRHKMEELLKKVENGAKLVISIDSALLSPFDGITGLEVQTRRVPSGPDMVLLNGEHSRISMMPGFKLRIRNRNAKVLAEDQFGDPVFAVNAYGKGEIYTLAYPIEKNAAVTPGILSGPDADPLYRFYAAMDLRSPEKAVQGGDPFVCMTEHIRDDGSRLLVLINCTPETRRASYRMGGTWHYKDFVGPDNGTVIRTDNSGFTAEIPAHTYVSVCIGK